MGTAHTDTFCRDNLPPIDQWPEMLWDLPELQYPAQLNVAVELLDKAVERGWGDRACVAGGEISWTYQELLDWSCRIANLLVSEHKLEPGNRVLLRSANNPWLVAVWFAVVRAGGVVVATMPLLRTGELAEVITKSKLDLALCDSRLVDELAAVDSPDLRILTWGDGGDDDLTDRARPLSTSHDAVDTAVDDVILLAFTSGTTGVPKATMHFHRDVLAIADTFNQILEPEPDDIFCGSPPLAFTFGLGGLVIFPLRIGASTVLTETPGPALLEAIEAHRCTVCFTAPTAYRAMLSALDQYDLSSLRAGVSAGETLPAATWEAFHEATGVRLIDGIGATEMLHVFISAAGDDIRPGATGKPVPGYTARIIDEEGQEAPDGTVGRLAVRGPTGCRYMADDRQIEYVVDGWNLTGDAYLRDSDGYFWFQARADDMIISSGYNIAGPEVEGALMHHDSVSECAVVGIPDEARGSIVKAHVVLRDGAAGDLALVTELQDHVKSTIAPYKYPRLIEFVDTLPKTHTGKVQRFKLREQG